MNLLERFSLVKMIVFDLDGVLTNGKVLLLGSEEWIREMDIKDGYAIQAAVKRGIDIVVITGSNSMPVKVRLKKLGVGLFFENVSSKSECLKKIMLEKNLLQNQVLFMGDDLPDLAAFAIVGIKTCPVDAVTEVKQEADFISTKAGGNGCAREIIEKVMKSQGIWEINTETKSL